MGLKAPGILVFLISVVIAVVALVAKFFGANIPFVDQYQFLTLLIAYILLLLGCVIRTL